MDIQNLKLGRLAPKKDLRTLKFADYYKAPVAIPAVYTWSTKVVNWGMMLNDHIGDCTIAAAAHLVQDWTANNNLQVNIPDAEVVKAYSAVSGYDAITGLNDHGCVEIDVLNYWRKQGVGGHKIEAYTSVNVHNKQAVMAAIYLFGGIYIGVALPLTAQTQQIWDTPEVYNRNSHPGTWGGHAVFICDFDQEYLTCVTWGTLKRMTWRFFNKYCDEAYAIISPDLFKENMAPNGFDIQALRKDMLTFN